MNGDAFGNLQDWGRVLDQLAGLRESNRLDRHQDGLVRILRYPDNWRLREETLKAVRGLRGPSDELFDGIIAIMMDENAFWEHRSLAAESLGHLVGGRRTGCELAVSARVSRTVEAMEAVLASPQPPALHESIRKVKSAIGKSR